MDTVAVQLTEPAPEDDDSTAEPRRGVIVPTSAVDRTRLVEDLHLLADVGEIEQRLHGFVGADTEHAEIDVLERGCVHD